MDQRHRRSGTRELERIEGATVAAADDHDVMPRKPIWSRFQQVGDITSEGAVRCGGELLVTRARGDHQRPSLDPRPVDLDRALAEVGPGDRVREAEAIAEEDRGVFERVTKAGTGKGRSGRHV